MIVPAVSQSVALGWQLLQAGKSPDPAQLSDPQFDLKSLMARLGHERVQ